MKIKDNAFVQFLIACTVFLIAAFALFYFLIINSSPQSSTKLGAKHNYGEVKITHYQEVPIYKVETDEGVICMVLEGHPYGSIDCNFPSENKESLNAAQYSKP